MLITTGRGEQQRRAVGGGEHRRSGNKWIKLTAIFAF
jgi:hypothetical protein